MFRESQRFELHLHRGDFDLRDSYSLEFLRCLLLSALQGPTSASHASQTFLLATCVKPNPH